MQEVIFHRQFQRDLAAALSYYDGEGGSQLGDRFFREVEVVVEQVTGFPERYHFIEEGLRRASLRTFPYHIVFEENDRRLRFLVLRHDRRHPSFGLRRR